MNRILHYVVILCTIFLVGSCSTTVNMYPIEGPLSLQSPLPILIASVDGITSNTGSFSFSLPDGSKCSGTWSSVAPQMISSSSTSLFGRYGSIAGFSITASNLPGVNRGQAFGVCTNNERFDVEFLTGSGTANGYGLASDTAGNVYKLIF